MSLNTNLIFKLFCLGLIGWILPQIMLAQNSITEAGQLYEKALESKNKRKIGRAAIGLGNVYIQERKNTSTAKKYFEEARQIADQTNSTALRADVFFGLGMVDYLRKKYTSGTTKFKQAEELYGQMRNNEGRAKSFYQGGMCLLRLGKREEAISPLKTAHNLAGKYKLYEVSAGASKALADLYDRKAENFKKEHENEQDPKRRRQYQQVYRELKGYARSYRSMYNAMVRSLQDIKSNKNEVNRLLSEQEKQEKEMLIKQLEIQRQEKQLLQHEDSLKQQTLELEIAQQTAEKKTAQARLLWILFAGSLALVLFAIYFAIKIRKAKQEIEKEQEKSEELLLNILPHEVAEELKVKGTATPRSYTSVSVLFTDFKGFTFMAEKLSPEEIINELNICFSAFDDIAKEHNLEKIKTIGDAYMCAGGIPIPNQTNPIDATLAGLKMQDFIEKRKVERQTKGLPFFELRLGINTGKIVAGVVGKSKFAYDIWGDAVNLASRMESSGEVGKVNISGNTYELIKDRFECTHRGKVKAKNKGEVDMYFVERIR